MYFCLQTNVLKKNQESLIFYCIKCDKSFISFSYYIFLANVIINTKRINYVKKLNE